jgi:hypothetical protein
VRRNVAPCRHEGNPNARRRRLPKTNACGTAGTPLTFDRNEHDRLGRTQRFLLLGREFDHGPIVRRITHGCEDLLADAKVGMTHVDPLDSPRHPKRQTSKAAYGHAIFSIPHSRIAQLFQTCAVLATTVFASRTPGISCEAVRAAAKRRSAQGGTSARRTGAALSFVSFIPLFDGPSLASLKLSVQVR